MFYHHNNIYSKIIDASSVNQIMNIMCFIKSNIYQHNNIYSKIIDASHILAKIFGEIKIKKIIVDCVALWLNG